MNKFNPKDFEGKWREKWEKEEVYKTPRTFDYLPTGQAGAQDDTNINKFYSLYSYPYPSGAGLHVGHVEGMVANDIAARFNRMLGKNVMMPMGWDSFGLPAENYAIKTGTPPQESTDNAIKTFIKQINEIGISVDWETEVGAHYPTYYKWTQWIFLQLFKHGLAYKKKAPVNWCPQDQTVLANEQVLSDGTCERCGSLVVQKELEQWFFKITEYANELDKDLEGLDWPESTKAQQRNWIGKSEGAEISFEIREASGETINKLNVFTTRPDTIFGATFLVVAPENEILKQVQNDISNWDEVEQYIEQAKGKTELERQQQKEKTGIKLEGVVAINPFTNEEIPIFVADYVLMGYGTGSIMAVPAHDERDFEFAMKYDISVKQVIKNENVVAIIGKTLIENYEDVLKFASEKGKIVRQGKESALVSFPVSYESELLEMITGNVLNGFFQDLVGSKYFVIDDSQQVHELDWFQNSQEILNKLGNYAEDVKKYSNVWNMLYNSDWDGLSYKSVVCKTDDGIHINSDFLNGLNVEEAKNKIIEKVEEMRIGKKITNYRLRDWLVSRQRYWGCPIPIVYDPEGNPHPVKEEHLPILLPTDVDFKPTGESPIKTSQEFVKRAEELYGEGWRFESDTLDTFIDSSWYFFRHTDAKNSEKIFDSEKVNYWLPTDLYMIGAEHIVLHLLYSRFFTKFFNKIGLIDFDEPFYRMRHMGTILGPDGRKMSKRWGNVINPTDEIEKYGADALRMYEMFMGPLEEAKPWNDRAELGVMRFLSKVWDLRDKVSTIPVNKSTTPPTQGGESSGNVQEREINKLIKKVSEDIPNLSFNTSVAKMMEFTNFLQKENEISKSVWERFLLVLAPFAPYITEELWSQLGNEFSIHNAQWPEFNESLTKDSIIKIAIQVNGKVRGTVEIEAGSNQDSVYAKAMEVENVKKFVETEPKKVIYVQDRIMNVIV